MVVNLYEPNGFNREEDWCRVNGDLLQIQENVLNQLNYEKDNNNIQFKQYLDAMELIDLGSSSIPNKYILVDEYFGSIGLPEEANYTIIKERNKLWDL